MKQGDLVLLRPQVPHAKGRETSKQAAKSIEPKVGTVLFEVLTMIRLAGDDGCTTDEIEYGTGMKHQTVSARVWDLHKRGFIQESGRTRQTSSGRPAIVWVAKK